MNMFAVSDFECECYEDKVFLNSEDLGFLVEHFDYLANLSREKGQFALSAQYEKYREVFRQ